MMRYWKLVTLFLPLVLVLSPASPATAQAPDAKPNLGANAAGKYWQAFALLPNLDKDQETLLEQWNKVPLDATALKLIDASRGSLEYLHRGAKLPHCDWSLDYQDGPFLRLPYLSKARNLARLVALNARHEFEEGHWKAGADDVTDLLKLARHLETDPIMIVQLLGFMVESTAIEAAAPYLPQLKPVLPEVVSAALNALPARPTLPQMVLKEKQIGPEWLIQRLTEAEQHKKGSWQSAWKELFFAPNEKGEDQNQELTQSAKTFDQAIKMLKDLLPFFDELANVTALPPKEFDAQYPEFVQKAKAANPLATFVLSSNLTIASERRNQAQIAMFKAAIAVVQDGPDKLKDIKDPFGDGPFEYRALDKGFELKSKLLFRDQPVTLTVGNGKKE
jgi:hypothetical protein